MIRRPWETRTIDDLHPAMAPQDVVAVRLWTAVLAQAVFDHAAAMQRWMAAGPERPQAAPEPVRWVESDENGIGSFVWICHLLDRDPGELRRKIRSRWPQNIRRIGQRS